MNVQESVEDADESALFSDKKKANFFVQSWVFLTRTIRHYSSEYLNFFVRCSTLH